MEDVLIESNDEDTKDVIQSTETNSYGYYQFENVVPSSHILRVSSEGFLTIERTFTPNTATQTFTLSEGNGTVEEDFTQTNSEAGRWKTP